MFDPLLVYIYIPQAKIQSGDVGMSSFPFNLTQFNV